MGRLRSWGPPTRLIVATIIAGAALFAVGAFVIHGTPTEFVRLNPHRPGRGHIPITPTGIRDYVRLVLDVGGIALVLFGALRWSTRRERAPQESEARHAYGDSIVDVRTSVDPQIGMRPVDTDPPRPGDPFE